jgi:hypothetical protein
MEREARQLEKEALERAQAQQQKQLEVMVFKVSKET